MGLAEIHTYMAMDKMEKKLCLVRNEHSVEVLDAIYSLLEWMNIDLLVLHMNNKICRPQLEHMTILRIKSGVMGSAI